MRWPWTRTPLRADPVPDDRQEAVRARHRAEVSLQAARDQTGEISEVVAQSRRHHRVNHFAELIAESFRGAQ